DDDGVRFYELASTFADDVRLLAGLDAESQQVFPGLAQVARRPSRAELREAMAALRQKMLEARREPGVRTVFYFYFAGHGNVGVDREGYLHLSDGRLTRSELYREVIGQSPADTNHVIIDACSSYFVINRRRGGEGHEQAIRSFLRQESLESYPNTGVL